MTAASERRPGLRPGTDSRAPVRTSRQVTSFMANDLMALADMDVLRYELGLRTPEQVSVVGCDDVPSAAWPACGLATVRQEASTMVAETVKLLPANIEHPDNPPRSVRPPSPLNPRASARIPERWSH